MPLFRTLTLSAIILSVIAACTLPTWATPAVSTVPSIISGRVVAPDGTAVKHAIVYCLICRQDDKKPPVWRKVGTGKDGTYRFTQTVTASDSLQANCIVAWAPGRAPAGIQTYGVDSTDTLTLAPVTTLKLKLASADGKPVSGARVTMSGVHLDGFSTLPFPDQLVKHFTAVTDRNGSCTLSGMPQGHIAEISIKADHFVRTSTDITLAKASLTEADPICLYRPATLRGRVMKDSTQPVAGLKVRAEKSRMVVEVREERDPQGRFMGHYSSSWGSRTIASATAVTDKDGRYVITDLIPGKYSLTQDQFDETAPDPGCIITKGKRATVIEGTTVDAEDLIASPGSIITGKLTAADDNAPLAGVEVLIQSDPRGPIWVHTRTDGTYQVRTTPGNHWLNIYQPPAGFQTSGPNQGVQESFTTTEGATVTKNYQFDRTPKTKPVHGHVIDPDGKPVAGASVSVEPLNYKDRIIHSSLTTDQQGEFTFDDGAPSAFRAQSGHLSTAKHVEAPEGGEVTLQLIDQAQSTVTLTGIVTDDDGEPVKGALVAIVGNSAFTDSEGNYTISGIPADASKYMEIYAHGYCKCWDGSVDYHVGGPFKPGETRKLHEMVLTKLDCAIDGRVVDEHGKPLPGMQVYLAAAQHTPDDLLTVDAQGCFHLQAMKGDHLRLSAFGPGMWAYGEKELTVDSNNNIELVVQMEEK